MTGLITIHVIFLILRVKDKGGSHKLNVKAFGLACGLIWGGGVFFLTWWVILFEGSTHDLMVLGHLYRGYNISPLGSVLGGIYGFFDGLVGGAIFAWLYNRLAGGKA